MHKSARKDPSLRGTDRWRMLNRYYQDRGLVLVLGAGISTQSNLPSWEELLMRVGETCWKSDGSSRVQKLIQSGMSLPAIAGVLQSECGKDSARFRRLLQEALYRDFPFVEQSGRSLKRAEQFRQLTEFVYGRHARAGRNLTLASVAALCVRHSPETNCFDANPGIHAVITSNVDVLLRTYIRARYGGWFLGTVESARKTRRAGTIPAYYMHGFIRYYEHAREIEDEPSHCVFTEEEYFDFFNRPYSVFNYTLLYLLREHHCLFIGMSMHDLNMRRLLYYSTAERREHLTAASSHLGLRHFAILKRPEDPEVERLTDISLRRIGTRGLWLDDFDELPDRLAALYGPQWPSVFTPELADLPRPERRRQSK